MDRLTFRLNEHYVCHTTEVGTGDLANRLCDYEDLEEKLIAHTGMNFRDWLKHTTSMFDER